MELAVALPCEVPIRAKSGRKPEWFAARADAMLELIKSLSYHSNVPGKALYWPGNRFLANRFGCSPRTVQRIINYLIGKGKLMRQIKRYYKYGRYLSRRFLRIVVNGVLGFGRAFYAGEVPDVHVYTAADYDNEFYEMIEEGKILPKKTEPQPPPGPVMQSNDPNAPNFVLSDEWVKAPPPVVIPPPPPSAAEVAYMERLEAFINSLPDPGEDAPEPEFNVEEYQRRQQVLNRMDRWKDSEGHYTSTVRHSPHVQKIIDDAERLEHEND